MGWIGEIPDKKLQHTPPHSIYYTQMVARIFTPNRSRTPLYSQTRKNVGLERRRKQRRSRTRRQTLQQRCRTQQTHTKAYNTIYIALHVGERPRDTTDKSTLLLSKRLRIRFIVVVTTMLLLQRRFVCRTTHGHHKDTHKTRNGCVLRLKQKGFARSLSLLPSVAHSAEYRRN